MNGLTNTENLYNRVVTIVKPYIKNEEGLKTMSGESRIAADLGVNSARLVDIILAMEDEFNISIDDETADKIVTLNDAVSLLTKKLQ